MDAKHAAPASAQILKRACRLLQLALLAVTVAACNGPSWQVTAPSTQGDPKNAQAFGYTPLDPIPTAMTVTPAGKQPSNINILEPMGDEVMRIAIGSFDASGKLSFGPVGASAANSRYVVILDYGKTVTQPIYIKKDTDPTTKAITATLLPQGDATANVIVPVYVGVGLRLTAEITTLKGGIDISTLVSIGANAADIRGTLSVQTLGISGENISTAIPFPADISVSSVQAAIQSLGTIKAKMYDPKTSIHPRAIGVYNNLGGGSDTINGIISSALKDPLKFPVVAQ